MMGPGDMPPAGNGWSQEPFMAPEPSSEHDYSLIPLSNGYYQLQGAGCDGSVYFTHNQLTEIMSFLNDDEYAWVRCSENSLASLAQYIVTKNLMYFGMNRLPDDAIGMNSSSSSNSSQPKFTLQLGVRVGQPDTRARHMRTARFATSFHEILECKKQG